jgi:hypothetical protein
MANSVDIEVQLTGAEEAKRGLEGIGETAGEMAGHFDKFNEHLGEGLGDVVGNVEELGGSFKELGSTIKSASKGGGASLMALVPALGGVVAAGFAVFETFQMIVGTTQDMENRQEAMSAASADLQAKLEALAEKGVKPTGKALEKFTAQTLKSQFAKEMLEKEYEKLEPVMQNYREALDAEIKRKADLVRGGDAFLSALRREREVTDEIREAREKLNRAVAGYAKQQAEVMKGIDEAAQGEKGLEDQSAESTLARVNQLKTEVRALELRELKVTQVSEAYRQEEEARLKGEAEILDASIKRNSEDAEFLANTERRLKQRRADINLEVLIADEIHEVKKAAREKDQEAERKARELRAKLREAEEMKRLARERQTQNELFAIRSLEIQHLKVTGATALELLDAQHQLELDKAGKNVNLRLMAEMRYEIGLTQLRKDQEQKRLEQEAELKAKQDAEADRRHEKFMSQIDEQNQKIRDQVELGIAAIPIVGDLAETFASGFAEATFGALAMGEGFQDSIVKIIQGLGKQAAVQALLETAKGVSALFLNPALAATHFKSAAIFGGAAALAGVSASALGGGGGGGGGGGASPSGAPQTAPTPQRETAQETSTVFNINFAGAVIYDTKQAAERAMVDRLVGVMNQRNRGSRRLNLGSV